MYKFNEYNGECTEGFLGNPEDFNGVVFILRESNLKKESDFDIVTEFWFKKVEKDLDGYCYGLEPERKEIARTRRVATKFINRFTEMLMFTDLGDRESLRNTVFCNINPQGGGNRVGKEYADVLDSDTPENMLSYLATLKEEITIFTCRDIYNKLVDSDNFENKCTEEGKGVAYKNKPERLDYTRGEVNGTKVSIYEIYHPTTSSRIITE